LGKIVAKLLSFRPWPKTNDHQCFSVLIRIGFLQNSSPGEFRFLGTLPSSGWCGCMCVIIRTCFKLAVADPFYACPLSTKDWFCHSKQLQIKNLYWFAIADIPLLALCPFSCLLQFVPLNQN
jgi:hypothetical protein